MIIAKKRHIFRLAVLITAINCGIGTLTIVTLYPREDWFWELMLTNSMIIILTMAVVSYVGTKLAVITRLQLQMKELVERDRLTDVATRDFFFNRLEEYPDAYGVSLMIDIDHFKSVNDGYGHLIGDKVIHDVAQIMKSQIRDVDVVCRFGGEEFVVFLHEATAQEGWAIAERIREMVADTVVTTGAGEINVTVSVGGSMKDRLEDIDATIKRADECLYRAKAAGRNQTIVDWPKLDVQALSKAS